MKKLLWTSVAASAVLIGASAAQAADPMPVVAPAVVAPTPPPTFSWTGGYIGGHAGLARGALRDGLTCDGEELGTLPVYFLVGYPGDLVDREFCFDNVNGGTLDPTYDQFDGEPPYHYYLVEGGPELSGYLAGVQIGFNYQFGDGPNGFVIGAEVAHSFADVQANFTSYDVFDGEMGWTSRFELSQLTTATLRVGYAFGRALAYGEVGLAIARASWTNVPGINDTEMAHGIVYGGGLEFAFGNNLSVFAEYNRVRLNHEFEGVTTVSPFGTPIDFPTLIGVESTSNIFKVGFNIHFGG